MITKIERNAYEALDDYIVKLCSINYCTPSTLFQPIIKSRDSRNHFLIDYLFMYVNALNNNEISKIIDEKVLLEIKMDVEELLGPFSLFLTENVKYLYDNKFKYCPECMNEGNHYLFHQLTFLDKCLIHDIPLHDRCPFCNSHYSSSIYFAEQGIYICPKCKRSLLDDYPKLTGFYFIRNSFQRKSIKLKIHKYEEESCLILDIDPQQMGTDVLPNKAMLFLGDYLSEKSIKIPDIVIPKNEEYTKLMPINLNYYFQSCSYFSNKKDYSKIDLSAIITLETAFCRVIKEIQATYNVELKWKIEFNNINRTTVNLRKEIGNWLNHTLLNDKKETSKQYAFYLWLLSNIFRDQSGEKYNSTLPSFYIHLLDLLDKNFSTKQDYEYYQHDTIEIAYNIIECVLYKEFLHFLKIIEDNHKDGDYISVITERTVNMLHMPFDISFLVFIFKNTLSYDLYLFEKDEIIEKENILMLSENSAKEIGGYDLAIRYNIKFE